MLESFTFGLAVLGALVSYLCLSFALRLRAQEAKRRAEEEKLPPAKVFDTSLIALQVEQVRQNYLARLQHHRQQNSYRMALFAAARQFVLGRSFFQIGHSEDPIR